MQRLRHQVQREISGKPFTVESGWIARQSNGAALVTVGDTVVLAAVVAGAVRENADDFVPLTVDYREKTSAAGKFPGGFIKREGRPTTREILTCRLIDRPIRPLVPEGFRNDLQIMLSVLSFDQQNETDVAAMNAASAALTVSNIPWGGPIGSVRIGLIDGRFVANPTLSEQEISRLDLVVSGTKDGVLMVEAGAREVPEERLLEAFQFAQTYIDEMIQMQVELERLCGVPKEEYELAKIPEDLYEKVRAFAEKRYREIFFIKVKRERNKAIDQLMSETLERLAPQDEFGRPIAPSPTRSEVCRAFAIVEDKIVRGYALENRRADGRTLQEIRPISIQTGFLPRTHGSALFTRGETQALVTATLGTGRDAQIVDGLFEVEREDRFMLHYNFPPFSTGETKPIRGPGRREIGHGMLAQRALEAVIPPEDQFPYTVRVISDILESNGSSSMATVCGATLALMDAGVPISAPVAGIAMGLVRERNQVVVLTDILGSEDANGDMDFKVAGTEKGITALQMDLKTAGLPLAMIKQALHEAREARLFVLGKMREAIASPRPELSPHAPRLVSIRINPEKIGLLIGPGGKTIRELEERTGVTIEINEDNSGEVTLASKNREALDQARSLIEAMCEELKIGNVYKAKVTSLRDFGAFVEILPGGQEGMVHVSEIVNTRDRINVVDYLRPGMDVEVKLIRVEDGRNRFSIRDGGRIIDEPPTTGPSSPTGPTANPSSPGGQRFLGSRPSRDNMDRR